MDNWLESKQLQVHSVSAAGLVYKGGKVLLIRSAERGWEFPGGVVEQGETILDALKREIREESGITAEPKHLAGIYQRLTMKPGYGPLEGMMIPPTVNLVFSCSFVSGTESISGESLEVGWFTPEEAKEMVTAPHFRKALAETLNYNGRTFFSAFSEKDGGIYESVSEHHVG